MSVVVAEDKISTGLLFLTQLTEEGFQ